MKSSVQSAGADAILLMVQATSSDFSTCVRSDAANDNKEYEFESIQNISLNLPYPVGRQAMLSFRQIH